MKNEITYGAPKLGEYIQENTAQRIVERYSSLVKAAQTEEYGVLDADVVVVDTETTGFSFNHDELIQIAAARMERNRITGWYVTFVNPGKQIPDDVVHLTHITDEMVADAPGPDEALAGLVEFAGFSPIVAHNANFDRTFTTKREAGAPLKENVWIDSLDLARIALPRMKSHRLLDLARAFGVPESTHRADDDVAATCLVYRVLLAAVAAMPAALVKHIAEMASVDEWNTAYVFQSLANPQARSYNLREFRRAAVTTNVPERRRDVFMPVAQAASSEETPDESAVGQSVSRETLREEALRDALAQLEFATDEEVEAAFAQAGMVGQLYDDYEVREEQKLMALSVNKAIANARNLAVEAGTGVGKSMAYLVPLAIAAKRNNMTVGVATKTNALLDQLVNKELPLLNEAMGITFAPLKGFSHYVCLRKLEGIVKRGPKEVLFKGQQIHQAPALAGLLSFVEQAQFDDMDGLKVDYRAIPRWSITTNSAECLRRKCPFFGRSCFVHGAREQAQRSDVVVTNHSLLFLDSRFDGGLLPPIRYWVVDEAHGAEAEARRAFATNLSSDQIRSLSRRVAGETARQNVFLRAQRTAVVEGEGRKLFESLTSKALNAGAAYSIAAEEYLLRTKDLLFFDTKGKKSSYEWFDLWLNDDIRANSTFQGVAGAARGVYDALEKLIRAARDLVALYESLDISSPEQREIALVALELAEVYNAIEAVFFSEADNCVRSVRMNRGKNVLSETFTVQPLDVGLKLQEQFYPETNSVVFASATLTVDNKFDSLERALGLNGGPESRTDFVQVDSSYDFDAQMTVYLPSDMPEPNDPAYLSTLQTFLANLHVAQQGSLLTLFTNRREMERCFEAVNPRLKEKDLRLVCQKWGVSTKGLRDDFLKDEHLSLFALKSFWEGFDAPGATLKGVVIPKLPFGLPTDPLSCERETIDDRAWAHYSLPAAVIEVKQAVGRLIRSSTDTGIVVLADHRLLSKHYGKKFLNSLPSRTVKTLTMAQIVDEVAAHAV